METRLEHIFGSRTRVKLLRLFTADPETPYFVRELARKIGEHMNSVRRELKLLEQIGVVQCTTEKRKRYCKGDAASALFPELKGLFLKADLLLERDVAKKMQKTGKLRLILLTGFFVGSGESVGTDILVVGQVNRTKFKRLVRALSKHFDHELRYTIMTNKEYDYRGQVTDRFLYQVLGAKHVILYTHPKLSI